MQMVVLWYLLLMCWAWPSQCWTTKGSSMGTPQQCINTPFVPGYNLGGEGFDIVTMERKGAYVIDTETWKLENGGCRMYSNRYMNNEKQKIPAAIVDWRSFPKCSMKVSSSRYNSAQSVMQDSTSSVTNDWKIGLSVQTVLASAGFSVGGSHSKESAFALQKSREDRYEFFRHSVHCTLYRYRLKRKPPLSPEFQSGVNSISSSLTNKQQLYRSLIDTYGTHFIRQVSLGGEIKATTAVKTCQATLNGMSASDIQDCLSVEASAGFASVSVSAKSSQCKKKASKQNYGSSFSTAFNERMSEVIGGNIGESDILFKGQSSSRAVMQWIKSLRTQPNIIRYNLKPLHTILPRGHPARTGLRKEVENYIIRNAVSTKCSAHCVVGHKSDRCACTCDGNQALKSNCCPAGKGFASLKVFNLHATGLYGDVITQTDGSVQVQYNHQTKRTRIIANNDNPTWPETFDFGVIKVNLWDKLKFEVYDEDRSWNSDLLGTCSFSLHRGKHSKSCGFKYGMFYFSYEVKCAVSLGGDQCQDYVSYPKDTSQAKSFYY
ncbi:unnamed protein product [Ophioblennius macclurei]